MQANRLTIDIGGIRRTASCSSGPEATVKDTTVPDTLTELLRKGARDLIAKAVEAELEALLAE